MDVGIIDGVAVPTAEFSVARRRRPPLARGAFSCVWNSPIVIIFYYQSTGTYYYYYYYYYYFQLKADYAFGWSPTEAYRRSSRPALRRRILKLLIKVLYLFLCLFFFLYGG